MGQTNRRDNSNNGITSTTVTITSVKRGVVEYVGECDAARVPGRSDGITRRVVIRGKRKRNSAHDVINSTYDDDVYERRECRVGINVQKIKKDKKKKINKTINK